MSNLIRRIVTTRMTLDLSNPDIQRDVTVTQGDTNRRFEITLVDSGHPYVLDANDKWTVDMTGVKPSGGTLFNTCDVAGGKIIYDFASGDQITTEAGAFAVQFNIYDETGEVLATPKIWVTVVPNANRDVVSENQFTAINELIARVAAAEKNEDERDARVDEAIEKMETGETARNTAEETRRDNETKRQTEETKRNDAETKRQLNEEARKTLQQQVNNLLSVPEGSTTADLALYDIRFGADGVTYETPGEAVRQQFRPLQAQVPEIDKRISNLESMIDPKLFVTDSAVAASKTVPATAAPYARVLEIGGMTYKHEGTLLSAKVTAIESVVDGGKSVFAIPEAVQALSGYGLGISNKYYNKIRWEDDGRRTYTTVVEQKVINGTENWQVVDEKKSTAYFYLVIGTYGYAEKDTIISDRYTQASVTSSNTVIGCNVLNSQTNNAARLVIRPENASGYTLASWKSYLAAQKTAGTPITVVYGLNHPVTKDISDLLPANNYIQVKGGATVTMVNEFGYGVPNTLRYQLKK